MPADASRHIDALLQTAPADNLYIARACELQQMPDNAMASANQPDRT